MKTIKAFVSSLFSRKLLVAGGSAAALAYEKQWYACAAVVVGYCASQAHVDSKTVAKAADDVVKAAPAVAAVAEAADPAAAPVVKEAEKVVESVASTVETSSAAAAVEAAPSTPVAPTAAVSTAENAAKAVDPSATPASIASSLEDDIRALVEKAQKIRV